jgi:cell division protein FtsI (penicillin-binding protein 3)
MSRSVRYVSSPLLASKTPVWRSKLAVFFLALGFLVLAARAAYVQVLANDFFVRQGEMRFVRTIEVPANRGRILDRNGAILAASVPASSVWSSPEDVEANESQLKALAKLLEMPYAELQGKLKDVDKTFVWLRRQLDDKVWKDIAALNIKGVHRIREYRRSYPEGEVFAHTVGFTGVDEKGQEGVELAFEKELAGKVGSRRVIKDRIGRVVDSVGEEVLPRNGQDIQLSLDSKIQFHAYQVLKNGVIANNANFGSVVVLDVTTGEILAMANYPSFDPNERKNLGKAALRNAAITDTFEPGSTMKPFTVATALDLGRITPKTVFKTSPGKYTVYGKTISDVHNYGDLTPKGIIQKSSNVGVTQISERLSAKEMWSHFQDLGFGQKPELEFPGVASGRVRAWNTWRPIEKATMSYGYGLSTSLLQLARAYTVFARDSGDVIPVTILKHGMVPAGVPVYSAKTVALVRDMLVMATDAGGSGHRAQTIGYSVGGKSGTARKQVGKTYTAKYRAWFAGLAPANSPRIVVAVMIDEPSAGVYYGGAVSAPVFAEVVQHALRILGVQPDAEFKPHIVEQVVADSSSGVPEGRAR